MRNSAASACASSVFTAAERITGRCAASTIAAVSFASLFCRLAKGLT